MSITDLRAARIDREMEAIRAQCKRDGLSDALTEEVVRDTRAAMLQGQTVRVILDRIVPHVFEVEDHYGDFDFDPPPSRRDI